MAAWVAGSSRSARSTSNVMLHPSLIGEGQSGRAEAGAGNVDRLSTARDGMWNPPNGWRILKDVVVAGEMRHVGGWPLWLDRRVIDDPHFDRIRRGVEEPDFPRCRLRSVVERRQVERDVGQRHGREALDALRDHGRRTR